ncbi:MAG TPA: hypothetical protein PLG34_05260 [Spirochaetota bacterium]|jgi:uncharacterized protein (DUF697 family)|nr:MAG: hypothetical protein BWX91_01350 [Spirochaetes bacterium ADurb.Bin133]HNZ26152.1 hypothetical protein [Spirochaetota bacterium]HPY87372.1 hypothetical protein [Spirochaetota bacterium]HQB60802.1 hypothetical protein [Spirochaetota bacterium]
MDKDILTVILYPFFGGSLNAKQREYVKTNLKIATDAELDEILAGEADEEKLSKIIENISSPDRIKYFALAKSISEMDTFAGASSAKMIKYAKLLGLKSTETGFDFDIYDDEAVRTNEFETIVKNFSLISGAVGFIPFVPVSDIFILTPLQIVMINSIFRLYDFEFDAKEFLKTAGATLGAGVVFRFTSKLLCNFVPFLGWAINSSVAFAGCYAIGIVARRYAEEKGAVSADSLKDIFEKAADDGKIEFAKLKDFILAKKEELINELKKYSGCCKNEETFYEDKEEPTDTRNSVKDEEPPSTPKKRKSTKNTKTSTTEEKGDNHKIDSDFI